MGLPDIDIIFKERAKTAVARSKRGVVAIILNDSTKTESEFTSYSYSDEKDITKAHWTADNLNYLNIAFLAKPKKVLVERVLEDEDYTTALARLKNKNWNYLAIPSIDDSAASQEIADWIIGQRKAGKSFKAVLAMGENAANNIGIINFATTEIVVGTKKYTDFEYCVRIAGILATVSLDESATGVKLSEVTSIAESTNPDKDIDEGKLILINDGDGIEIARAVNSLTELSEGEKEELKKIKIVEGMDLIRDDIRDTFRAEYKGKNNSYDNKMLFVGACNQYFVEMARQGVLYDDAEHKAEINVEKTKEWLAEKYDISEYTDEQIKKAKTGSWMFMKGNVTFSDAAEDLSFEISME